MTDAEKAVLAGMTAEAKAAVKALLRDFADVELPKIISAEEARLPVYAQPLVAGIVTATYPQVQAFLDAKIDAI